jgi:protease I
MVLAGADWTDEPVVVDRKLVTSRRPADLPFFMKEVIANIAKD